MKIASIAFNVPQHIDLDKTAEIQLLLSLDQTVSQLQSQLEEAGARTGSQIRVSQSMEAALTGPHFQIEAITPEAQAITQHGATEWKWEVVPKKSGRLNLHLTLTAIVEMEGRSVKHAIRTFDKTIEINVSFNQRATAFIEENWKWLWATILVPLAAWLLRRRRKGEG